MSSPEEWESAEPEPQSDPERQETPKRETMWVAVGALAAVVAALIALLTYVTPRSSATPIAATTPATTYSGPAATPTPTTPTTPTTPPYTPPATSPAPATSPSPSPTPTTAPPSSPPPLIQAGPPAGCDGARADLATYDATAGSTTNSEYNAAEQAYQNLSADYFEANGDGVADDINTLATDFDQMTWILSGETSLSYAAAVAQTNSDIKTLSSACGFS
jgi:hypothetical protein